MIEGQLILCDSNVPWQGNRYSKHHLMSRLARHNDVVFMNPQVDACVYAREKGWRSVRNLGARFEQPADEALQVFTPLSLPYRGKSPHLVAADQRYFTRQVRAVVKRYPGRDLILFIGNPWNVFLLDAFPECKCSIYHCSDNFPAGFTGGLREKIEQREAELVRRVDLVACTHDLLWRKCKDLGGKAHLVEHAVDERVFRPEDPGPDPHDLAQIPSPRAVYIGSLDQLIDFELLGHLADQCPEFSFVLVGPVAEGSKASFEPVQDRPNVHWLGRKQWTELPSLLWHSDVGIMPFLLTDWTAGGSPLKLFEYLAAALPVVATRMHEFAPTVAPFVRVADTTEQFVEHLHAASADQGAQIRQARMKAVEDTYTWNRRVAQLGRLIEEALAQKS